MPVSRDLDINTVKYRIEAKRYQTVPTLTILSIPVSRDFDTDTVWCRTDTRREIETRDQLSSVNKLLGLFMF